MGKILIIKAADFSEIAVNKVEPEQKINITVVASPTDYGTVTGSGSYEQGEYVEITAIANRGYKFIQWSDGNTESTRAIIVGSNSETYTAIFEVKPEIVLFDKDVTISRILDSLYMNSTFVVNTIYGDTYRLYRWRLLVRIC